MKKNKITVVGGAGHIGLPLSIVFANKGFDVAVLDKNLTAIDMAKKGARIVVTLECTESRSVPRSEKRSAGVSRYTTEKNKRNTTERLELKKFCPELNKMTIHREIK